MHAELVEEDPSNLAKSWDLAIKSAYQAQLLDLAGRNEESWNMSLAVGTDMRELMGQDQDFRTYHASEFGIFLTNFAYLAYRRGESADADRLLKESISLLSGIAGEHPDNKTVLYGLTMSYFYYWLNNDARLPDGPSSEWLVDNRKNLNLEGCWDLDIVSRLAVMNWEMENARRYSAQLLQKGFREPEFMRFCRANELCAE